MTPLETVNEFIRRMTDMDLDRACELVTDDVEYDNVPMGKTRGPVGIQETLGPVVDALDEVEWIVHNETASGNLVMNERSDRFRLGDKWMTLPVAGVFELNDDGKITLWRDYFDAGTFNTEMARLIEQP